MRLSDRFPLKSGAPLTSKYCVLSDTLVWEELRFFLSIDIGVVETMLPFMPLYSSNSFYFSSSSRAG